MAELLSLVGPDGREYEFNPAEGSLDAALAKGYRVLRPGESTTLGEDIKAGANEALDTATAAGVGALEGATFGLTKPLTNRVMNDPSLMGRKFAEEHETAKDVGEFAGMLLSPLNKVAGVGKLAVSGTGAAARIGSEVVGGMAIGALAGAGNTVGDASIPGAPELTAEKLIYGAGLGAVLGGAGGGIGGVISEGAGAILPKVGKMLGGAGLLLDEFANDAALKATRAQQGVISTMTEQDVRAAAQALRDRGHLKLTPREILQSLKTDVSKLEGEEKSILEQMAADAAKAPEELPGRTGTEVTESGRTFEEPTPEGLPGRDGFDVSEGTAESGMKMGNTARRRAPSTRTMPGRDAAYEITEGSRFTDEPTGLPGAPGFEVAEGSRFPDLKPHPLEGALKSSRETLGAVRNALRLAESGASRPGGMGVQDMLFGVAASHLHPMGIASAVGSKFLREYGPGLIAKGADAIAKSPSLKAVAQSFSARMAQAAPALGEFAPVMADAMAKGPQIALATHMLMAQSIPSYAEAAQQAGFLPESPVDHAAALTRATSLAQVTAALAQHDDSIDKHVDAVFRGEKAPKVAPQRQEFGAKRLRRADTHEAQRKEVAELAANPEALLERLATHTASLGNVAPAVGAALAQSASKAVSYLAASIQAPVKQGPLAPEWVPSDAQKQDFAQAYAAITNPQSVMRKAAAGTMTPKEWEAIQAVYPLLARAISDRALEKLTSQPRVPYRARLMVSMLAGVSADGSSSASSIALNQAAIHSAPKKAEARQQSDSPLKLGNRMAMPGQRRQMEET